MKTTIHLLSRACFLAGLTLLSSFPTTGFANQQESDKVIAGWIEKVTLRDEPFILKAKLDTGATISSIHAEDIEPFRRDGEKWVRFNLVIDDANQPRKIPMEKPRVRKVRIKNHDGNHDSRFVVRLETCFDGRYHLTDFTLTGRDQFLYPVLLGREFLAGVAVVDPQAVFLTQANCS